MVIPFPLPLPPSRSFHSSFPCSLPSLPSLPASLPSLPASLPPCLPPRHPPALFYVACAVGKCLYKVCRYLAASHVHSPINSFHFPFNWDSIICSDCSDLSAIYPPFRLLICCCCCCCCSCSCYVRLPAFIRLLFSDRVGALIPPAADRWRQRRRFLPPCRNEGRTQAKCWNEMKIFFFFKLNGWQDRDLFICFVWMGGRDSITGAATLETR